MIMIIQIVLAALVIFGVAIIVVSRNVIHAAYALALVLISLAGVYVLLNAELLAVVQILLYAGGVIILLVFGVMMTNRINGNALLSESKNVIVASLLSITVFSSLSYVISEISFGTDKPVFVENQMESIGISFLTEHIVAFELIAFVLLLALVGASYLAKMSSDE